MTANVPPTDDELGEYVDGGLSEQRRAEVAAWLIAHPDKAAEADRVHRLNEAFKELGSGILEEPVPERLRQVLRGPASRAGGGSAPEPGVDVCEDAAQDDASAPPGARDEAPATGRCSGRNRSPLAQAVAAVMVFVLGGALGWSARPYLGSGTSEIDQILAEASKAYAFYTADGSYPTEFPPERADALEAFTEQLFQRSIMPPDLEVVGYRYRGARLAPSALGTSTLFFFESEDGRHVMVSSWPAEASADPADGVVDLGELVARFWSAHGFGFAVIGKEGNGSLGAITDQVSSFYRRAWSGS